MMAYKHFRGNLLIKILILIILVPLGFYTKNYQGPLQEWVNYSFCDFLYEIFWCFVISLLFKNIKTKWIALTVFGFTSILEFMQLWHPSFLQVIRATFLGRTLIGNFFAWSDFFYYATGCLAGYFLLIVIDRKGQVSAPEN